MAGSQIIFFDDFSNENIGDFPASWLSNASGEVVTTSLLQGKWFKMNTSGNFFLYDGLKVSENFTLEFDMFLTREGEHGDNITISLLGTDEDDLYPNLRGTGKSGIEIELVTIESGMDGFSYRAFHSGKDVVKPNSYGAIKEIATILQENPTLMIKIVGHTDSDGDDNLNLDLSKRRSGNVKNVLSGEFKIDASRIETDGMGESEPLIPNTNAGNKAKNRRVEFIKI